MEVQKEEKKTAGTGDKKDPDTRKEKRTRYAVRIFAAICLICAVCAGGYGYYYNLPAQRMGRMLEAADELLDQAQFEEAADTYRQALEIDPEDAAALEGLLLALTGQADSLALEEEIEPRAKACVIYEEILEISRNAAEHMDPEEADPEEARSGEDGGPDSSSIKRMEERIEETEQKLTALRASIAASYESLETITVTDDRSGKVVLPDGTEKPYTWHYDLVQTEDPCYPYADSINDQLAADRDLFFAGGNPSPADMAAADGAQEGEYRDYMGVAGVYSAEGLLSVRMAEVRIQGTGRACFYRGKTFRLADAQEITLSDLTGKTDSGLRRLIKQTVSAWLEQEGYTNISVASVEDYVEDTEPDDFKFCIRDDGRVCLLIDQEVPFFATGSEILEIPLQE